MSLPSQAAFAGLLYYTLGERVRAKAQVERGLACCPALRTRFLLYVLSQALSAALEDDRDTSMDLARTASISATNTPCAVPAVRLRRLHADYYITPLPGSPPAPAGSPACDNNNPGLSCRECCRRAYRTYLQLLQLHLRKH